MGQCLGAEVQASGKKENGQKMKFSFLGVCWGLYFFFGGGGRGNIKNQEISAESYSFSGNSTPAILLPHTFFLHRPGILA